MTRGEADPRDSEGLPRAAGGSPRVLPGNDPAAIREAAALIRSGELVAFPTETVYGLGAHALDPTAVARIFAAKERPSFDPLIVHLADPAELVAYTHPADAADPRVARLAARFWPGPLTLVLRKRDNVPGIVTAGLSTVGLRVPDHPVALALIRAAHVPIAAPSANRFGRVSPTRASHVVRGLGARVRLVLDGGPCRVGVESTVVLLADGRAALLRPGGVAAEAIEAEIGPLEVPVPGAPGSPPWPPARRGRTTPRAPAWRSWIRSGQALHDACGRGPMSAWGSSRRRPPAPRRPGPRVARSRRCSSSRPMAIR